MMSFLRKTIADQSGQSIVMLVGAMMSLCAMAGLTLDLGHAYIVRSQLQNAVNAAGLAGAGSIYNKQSADADSAKTVALAFLAKNPVPGVTSSSADTGCRDILQAKPWTCVTNPTDNAIVVTESVAVPTTFMRVFGMKTVNVTSTATASMQSSLLWNFAVIEDLTGSMSTIDTKCGMSKFSCTLNALQSFLGAANPCPGTATYGSACKPDDANLRIAIFGFPNMLTSALPSVTACSSAPANLFTVDTLPLPTATSYSPMKYAFQYQKPVGTTVNDSFTASYEVTYGASGADANGFLSDYYDPTNAATGHLNPSSALVQAIGYTGTGAPKAGCLLLAANSLAINGAVTPPAAGGPGVNTNTGVIVNTTDVGEGLTYLASVIYAAQAALTAEKARMLALGKVTHNAIILQSDGSMNMQWIYFPHGLVTQNPPAANQPSSGKYIGNFKNYNLSTPAKIDPTLGYSDTTSKPDESALIALRLSSPSLEATGTISGLYPDFLDECQQTIIAAQHAAQAGTRVYSIAYGAETVQDCGIKNGNNSAHYTDVTTLAASNFVRPLYVSFTAATLSPCIEMKNAASDLDYFYSYSASGDPTSCVDTVHTGQTLVDAYNAIHASIGTPHLIPNDAN
jgi:Flp pilus assembly protein TadG